MAGAVDRSAKCAAERKRLQRARAAAGLVGLTIWVPNFDLTDALFDAGRIGDWRADDPEQLAREVEKLVAEWIASRDVTA